MTLTEIKNLLSGVQYKDWTLRVEESPVEEYIFLQWRFMAPDLCSATVEPQLQSCRKWLLSRHMTRSEIVATAFKAALSAEEHECREQFLFQGLPIYGPHKSLEKLVYMAQCAQDRREAVTSIPVKDPDRALSAALEAIYAKYGPRLDLFFADLEKTRKNGGAA